MTKAGDESTHICDFLIIYDTVTKKFVVFFSDVPLHQCPLRDVFTGQPKAHMSLKIQRSHDEKMCMSIITRSLRSLFFA